MSRFRRRYKHNRSVVEKRSVERLHSIKMNSLKVNGKLHELQSEIIDNFLQSSFAKKSFFKVNNALSRREIKIKVGHG